MSNPYRIYTPEDRALADEMAAALARCDNIASPVARGLAYGKAGDLTSRIAELHFQRFGALDRRAQEIARSRVSRTGERVAGVLIAPVMCALVAAASLIDPAKAAGVAEQPTVSAWWVAVPAGLAVFVGVLVILAHVADRSLRAKATCADCYFWKYPGPTWGDNTGAAYRRCFNHQSPNTNRVTRSDDACAHWEARA